MYKFLFAALLFVMSSCNQQSVQEQETDTTKQKEAKQTLDISSYKDRNGSIQLIGEVNEKALQQEPYIHWFKKKETYQPNEDVVAEIKQYINDYDIEVFFGSWCGDSKRDLPIFLSVLDKAEFNTQQLKIYAVGNLPDNYKKSKNGEEEGKEITNVPTFIFYKDGVEVNRIVESTIQTMEQDILAIVKTNNYKHKYADF